MKPGIHFDIDPAAYFADPCPQPSLTQSIAKVLIDRSPAHARLASRRLNPDYRESTDYTAAQAIGNAAHKLLLGRGRDLHIIEADDFRGASAKATRDSAIADGKIPILAKHERRAAELAVAAHQQILASQCPWMFISDSERSEAALVWQEDGLWFRSLIDWHVGKYFCDLKTSGRSAAPHAVPATMADADWAIQAAFQERGLDVLDPWTAGRRHFYFVMIENEPPYALTINLLSEEVMTTGRKQVDYAVRIWRKCMESGEWPAYPPQVNVPEMPGYKEAQWLNREVREFDARNQAMLTDLAGG